MDIVSVIKPGRIQFSASIGANLNNLILTISDIEASKPALSSNKRKTGIVDALCDFFDVPKQTEEPPPRSSAGVFLDLANKVVGYVAVFSSKTASLVTGINLVFELLRYANEGEEYASSRHAVVMICCTLGTVLTSIFANIER